MRQLLPSNTLPASSLRRALAPAVLAIALAGMAAAQPSAQPAQPTSGPRPRAVVGAPIVDLGEVVYGNATPHEFVIENTGDAPLSIHAANSTCACTVVEFTPEIAPGAKGKLTVLFDAQLQSGPVAISIEAVTNDPDSPRLRLTLKAFVKYHVLATPGYARYLVVQGFEGDSLLSQYLWSLDDRPMTVTKVETPYDFIETSFREARPEELQKEGEGRQQWKVDTRISPQSPVGAISGFITIHVDHPAQKIVKLPLHGFVRPIFAVTPAAADWGELQMGSEGYETTLHVKNFAEETIKLATVETTVAGVTGEVEEVEPGRVYWVKLHYSPEMAKGKFSGVVRIKTESPKQPTIEVPLKGTIL